MGSDLVLLINVFIVISRTGTALGSFKQINLETYNLHCH